MEQLFEEKIPGLKTRNYVNLNKLKKGNYYYYNSYPLGYFNEIHENSLVFSKDEYDENTEDDDKELNVYPIISINQNEIPSSALLEEVEPQTIHLEDVSVYDPEDYLGGRRKTKKNKSKKSKKKFKKNKFKKRYSRKYR